MNNYEKENRKRGIAFVVAIIIFILASTSAVISGLSMIHLTGLHTSAESAKSYGYDVYFINNEQVSPHDFHMYLGEYSYHTDPETNEIILDVEGDTQLPYGTYSMNEIEEGFSIQHINPDFQFNEKLYEKYMGMLWIITIISAMLMPISLIIAIKNCGQRNPDGSIRLNWFDRIFTEIQVAAALAVSLGIIPVYILFETWFASSEWIKTRVVDLFNNYPDLRNLLSWMDASEWHGTYYTNFFQPTWVLLLLAVVCTIAIAAFDVLILTSLVKKIKARRFWRGTIIGSIIGKVTRAVERNKAVSGKVYLLIIGFTIIAAFLGFMGALAMYENAWVLFWILFILGIILIALTVLFFRKQVEKYKMVKEGLSEVQKGNFSYKIPDLGNGEFGRLAESVNSITDAQNEAIRNEIKSQRLRSELISNVSHDLRTPLTSMVSYVDLLKSEGLDSPNAKEYLDIISEKTNRLHKLTDNLFEAAKASSGDIPVNIERIDLDAIARQAIAELEENIASSNVDLVYSCKVENPEVMADGNLLWRVIENLITNISKYALPGTRAYVDIVEKPAIRIVNSHDSVAPEAVSTDLSSKDRIALEVKNMSREALNISAEELMERFQRGDDSRNTDGSGLGLAIANDLTALMNGKFDIYVDGDLFKATVELKKAPIDGAN